ncbi:MAG: L-2-hydroxyglutarate oxidase [Patulibacter sp.]
MRTIIVGGGIVGLATARALLLSRPGDELIVLERDAVVAQHQSGRNSGVIHAGVYYLPGSLKARLCRHGAELMIAYCQQRGLPLLVCGKVVVALDASELGRLDELERRATANGVPGLTRLGGAALRAIEPHAAGIAALHSPRTAITDFAAVAQSFADDVAAAGGSVVTGASVARVEHGTTPAVLLDDGARLAADRVIICAGLSTAQLARRSGAASEPRIIGVRGDYYALSAPRRAAVCGLIYPVPDPALPFLGIHLTRRVDGTVLVGPNAVPTLARRADTPYAVDLRELLALARWPGTWRLARRQWRTATGEWWRSRSTVRFVAEAERYLPGLSIDDVEPIPAGIRAQAVDRDGSLVDDFCVENTGTVAWVRNAPSPAATSSLALAEELLERLALTG